MRSSFQADHNLPNDTYCLSGFNISIRKNVVKHWKSFVCYKIWAISGLLYPQRLSIK